MPVAAATLMLLGAAYVLVFVARRRRPWEYRGGGPLLFTFTVLGVTVGFATAYSRTATVGAVLPALVTLMSGVLTYSVTKDGLPQFRPLLPHCITLLSLASLLGLSIDSTARKAFDKHYRDLARHQLRYERLVLEGEKAKYLTDLEIYKQQQLAEIAAKGSQTSPDQPTDNNRTTRSRPQ